jgi:serine/threonine-protein kinase
MELVEGETSRARVDRKGRLEMFEALAIVHGTIKALKAAHEQKLIHRDIKPGNILISREAKIKLADLGLAKSLDQSALDLTLKGSKLGTPRYAAPEQWQDASEATPATDVYAIGAVLYFFLTGEDGIKGDSALEVIANTCRKGFPRLSSTHAGFPPEIDQFIAKCAALRPEDRFQSAIEMLRFFEPMVRKLREQRGVVPGSSAAKRPPAPTPRRTPERTPIASNARRGGGATPASAVASDRPRDPAAAGPATLDSGHRRFLGFIGVFGILVYSVLLWLAGQHHRSVLAAGMALAAAIAVLLVVYRRRVKKRRFAAAPGED